jgi:hypothetical protein
MQERSRAEVVEAEAGCCSTNDGSPSRLVLQGGQQCGSAEHNKISTPVSSVLVLPRKLDHDSSPPDHQTRWMMMRSGLLFLVGCLTSPCCAPMLVPIGLTLLAGTPVAVFLTQYLGWVYGVLTVVSVGSFLLTFLALRRRPTRSSQLSR